MIFQIISGVISDVQRTGPSSAPQKPEHGFIYLGKSGADAASELQV